MTSEPRIDQTHGQVNYSFEDIEFDDRRINSQGPDCLPAIDERNVSATEEPISPVSFLTLFRFSSQLDIFLMSLGAIAAIGAGMCFPFMTIHFSLAVQSMIYAVFDNSTLSPVECINTTFGNETFEQDFDSMHKQMVDMTINMSVIGLAFFLLAFTLITCFNSAAENQMIRIKSSFFKGILRQDVAWHDSKNSNDFASRITEDLNKVHDGISEKIGMFLVVVSSYLTALIIAFLHGWLFTLVMMIFTPLMSLSITLVSNVQSSLARRELKAYAESSAVAEEVLDNIRTVVSFEGQEKETRRFQLHVQTGKKIATKRGLATACIAAIAQGFPLLSYALGFWYGSKLINDPNSGYSPSDVLIVFFCALGGSSMMGTIAPFLETFAISRAAAAAVFRVIDRIPQIDINSLKGIVPETLLGRISFQKVYFSYPSRPDVPVLNGITFDVFPGQTLAIVGESGCGKSTCVHLIQRFYDTQRGHIALDGQKVQDLSVNWLRSQIGVVNQEPSLFGVSIADNIRYGREDVTQAEIEEAAKEANAYEFIQRLPNKFRTVVNSDSLSAGQKQRIAIARALVRNPKILLLDEATSALDGHSELVVQRALDKARKERTVIVVAHRLSTIRNADRIIVIKNGVAVEEGTHENLFAKRGAYYELSVAQQQKTSDRLNSPSMEDQEEKAKEWLFDDDDFLEATTPYGSVCRRHKPTFTIPSEPETVIEAKMRLIDLLRLNQQERWYIAAGIIASIVVGLNAPVTAFLLGEMLTVFIPSCFDGTDGRKQTADVNSLLFLTSAFILAISALIQAFCFSVAGEGLTCRMRDFTFQAIMKRDIAWFDENRTGSLCARLSGDAAAVQGGTGQRLGLLFQSISTLAGCVILSFYYEWKLGFVSLAMAPLLFAIAYLQGKIIKKQSALDQDELKQSANLAVETIKNIRTVTSLGQQKLFHRMYVERLRKPHRRALKNACIRGVIYGLANSLPMVAYATTMYYGSTLLASGLAFQSVIKVSQSLTSGMQAIGQSFAFAPNYYAAKMAAGRIVSLIVGEVRKKTKRRDEILGIATGDVDFDRVHFRYPTRPEVKVLRDLSFSVRAGQNVALVGPSGAGKSTCFQLIQRFYDPNLGEIRMDFLNLKDINTKSLRSQIGVVSQEPVLFNRSIRDNIAYGDNSRKIPMEEIIEAARRANIHSFVQSLPKGYDTMVGHGGTQLSGGQKQRIAIARALVRNPSVLLLDEATSSLDYENEKVVQMALDKAREGRTCFTIAHRLSTVRNADNIVVIRNGKIEEQGTHDDLLRIGGMYAALISSRGFDCQPNEVRKPMDATERLL